MDIVRKECLDVFEKYKLDERQVVDMAILAMSGREKVSIPNMAFKAYLTADLEIIYNDGKRYGGLEVAIQKYFKVI